MHPWLALGLLVIVAVIAWAWTRSLRRDWYPPHVIGLAGLAVLILCGSVGYCGARYAEIHVSRGVPD